MRVVLEGEFGVPVRWTEDRSRTTQENARYSAEMLKAAAVTRIVLVVHGADMPRAMAEFADQGIAVMPAPTGLAPSHLHALDFVPSMVGLEGSYHAIYEFVALAVRWIDSVVR
jgi:uncharacterized SAM-binding protein YcdF (DUF218 family)